jgi:anti-sigma B factor antagonist
VRTEYLTIKVDRYGQVCVLAVRGELDLGSSVMFIEFTEGVAAAMTPQPQRVVVDLSGLRFIDCSGARALAAVASSPLGRCPVVLRSVRPAVHRVLDLMGLDLVGPSLDLMSPDPQPLGVSDTAADSPTGELVRQLRLARSHSEQAIADCRRVAGDIAATEDRMALTLTQLAACRPNAYDRLTTLSRAARRQAVRLRDQSRAEAPRTVRN